MSEIRSCIQCGNPLPFEAPEGFCPACMLRAGREPNTRSMPEGSAGENVTFSFEPAQPGHVLENLARSIGPIPRVLLPETAADDTAPTVTEPSTDEILAPAERGGRYQFFGEIARGGMGAVLRGRDPDLGRDLAVKVLLESHEDKPEMVRRFVEEAQIGGQLQHPGIVPVYELGAFADRRPYFTMKLVNGRTLASLLAERESPAHDLPRFLSTFEAICQTMAYAHARGVIHRDLKPSNVMVGSFGEVQVMDWGLAKVLKEPGAADEPPARRAPAESLVATVRSGSTLDQSQAGSVLGTPAYMAPEQAAGETERVDRRADVFGLGSILCQILTGQPAYTGQGVTEILRKAMRGETADALARLAGCGAEAELITLARDCMAVEPEDRPRDSGLVAQRITAYLTGVQERVQSAERELAVAVVRASEERKRRRVQLALAATVALALLGGGAAGWWQRDTNLRRRLVDEQRAAAENARLARNAQAVAALVGQAEEALRAGDTAKGAVALEAARKTSAEGGAEQESDRLERLDRDLSLLRDLDAVDQFRWTLYENRLPDQAVVAARTRDALKQFGADPETVSVDEAAARVSASVVHERIVTTFDRLLRQQRTEEVRALLRRVDPEPYRDAVRNAVLANDPAKMVDLAAKDEALKQPPGFAAFLGESPAISVDRRRELLQAAVTRRPADLEVLMTLADTYLGNPKKWVDELVRWYQAAVAAAPTNTATHANLGYALREKGQLDEPIACFRKAIELDPKHAVAHFNLGNVLAEKGDLDEASACFRKAIELDPSRAAAHFNLGNVLRAKGQLDEAIACHRKAVEVDPNDAQAHGNLGIALQAKGRLDEAIACHRKAIELDPELAWARSNLAGALNDKGQLDEAIACSQKAIELDPKDALGHFIQAVALSRMGRLDEAIACYRKAIELDPKHAMAHFGLGDVLLAKGQLDEATAAMRMAIRLKPKDGGMYSNIGRVLGNIGRHDEAIEACREAIRLNPNDGGAHYNLGKSLAAKGRLRDSLAAFQKAHELEPALSHSRFWQLRYHAACAAARAASGHGTDEPPAADAAKARLRGQALDWLKAELTAWGKVLETGSREARLRVIETFQRWKQGTDLAGVRDAEALAKLPDAEQKEWRTLWAEVDLLLKRTASR